MHLIHEMEELKNKTFALVAVVEENLSLAVKAVQERDAQAGWAVIKCDEEIDRSEVTVEEECLKLLALHQPVAVDLRLIIAVLKLNSDLERIGDLAVNIAERAIVLCELPEVPVPFDFNMIAVKASLMVQHSLDALVDRDVALAKEVCQADDEVDDLNREIYHRVKDAIRNDPEHLDALIHLLQVARHLERVADHATNIAEDVIYLVEGRIVRHKSTLPPG